MTMITGEWLEVEVLPMPQDPEAFEAERIVSMRCSVCKKYHGALILFGADPTEDMNYCPSCGARMRLKHTTDEDKVNPPDRSLFRLNRDLRGGTATSLNGGAHGSSVSIQRRTDA